MTDQPATATTPAWPTKPCEACKAPIIWARSAAGDRIAVDAAPSVPPEGQKAVLLYGIAGFPLAEVVTNPARLFGRTTVYRRHLDTCPFQAHYRSRAARRRGRS